MPNSKDIHRIDTYLNDEEFLILNAIVEDIKLATGKHCTKGRFLKMCLHQSRRYTKLNQQLKGAK